MWALPDGVLGGGPEVYILDDLGDNEMSRIEKGL